MTSRRAAVLGIAMLAVAVPARASVCLLLGHPSSISLSPYTPGCALTRNCLPQKGGAATTIAGSVRFADYASRDAAHPDDFANIAAHLQ